MLKKIHGLWRHDGDTEPVLVSRRSFLFLGGVVAAGAMVPGVFAAPKPGWAGVSVVDADLVRRYLKMRTLLQDHGQPFSAQGEWLMSPRAYRELRALGS